jgi:dipeptidyl aminopeptidase/acylaminoacyl peptidase
VPRLLLTQPGGFVHSVLDPNNAAHRVNAASWSPDGTKIVFSQQGPEGGKLILPATGGRPQRLLTRPHDGLAWQPLPAAQVQNAAGAHRDPTP